MNLSRLVLVFLVLTMCASPALSSEKDVDMAAARRAAKIVNAAAFDIYNELAQANEGRNILFSPASLSMTFAMLHLVTQSQDLRTEIARTFHFTDSVHSDMPELMKLINSTSDDTRGLKISNVFWSQLGKSFGDADILTRSYGEVVKYVDFKDSSKKNNSRECFRQKKIQTICTGFIP